MNSEKCVKGHVVTDVGRDLGGGSLEHVQLCGAEKGCCSHTIAADYQQVNGMKDVVKIF